MRQVAFHEGSLSICEEDLGHTKPQTSEMANTYKMKQVFRTIEPKLGGCNIGEPHTGIFGPAVALKTEISLGLGQAAGRLKPGLQLHRTCHVDNACVLSLFSCMHGFPLPGAVVG